MFTVGCDSSRSFACSHGRSLIQCWTVNCFFASASLRVFDTFSIIVFSSAVGGSGFG